MNISLVISILVLSAVLVLFFMREKKNKETMEKIEVEHKKNIEKSEQDIRNIKENEINRLHMEYKKDSSEKEKEYEKVLEKNKVALDEVVSKYEKYAIYVKKTSKNQGEIITNNQLNKIKKKLIEQGVITDKSFMIHSNIMFMNTEGRHVYVHQIDHLVVSTKGIYAIESKYWKGAIFHEQTINSMSSETKILFPNVKTDDEICTFVVQNDAENGLTSKIYGNPTNQVKHTCVNFYQYLLGKKVILNNHFIKGLVYYNYKIDECNYVVDHKGLLDIESDKIEGFTSFESMELFFTREFQKDQVKIAHSQVNAISEYISNYL